MLRIKKLIGRTKLWDLYNDPLVHSVEVRKTFNMGLKNPDICRIIITLETKVNDSNNNPIHGILGCCEKYGTTLSPSDNAFLKGLKTQKTHGWLSASHIRKLSDIEKRNNINLSIPKNFYSLIKQYS